MADQKIGLWGPEGNRDQHVLHLHSAVGRLLGLHHIQFWGHPGPGGLGIHHPSVRHDVQSIVAALPAAFPGTEHRQQKGAQGTTDRYSARGGRGRKGQIVAGPWSLILFNILSLTGIKYSLCMKSYSIKELLQKQPLGD